MAQVQANGISIEAERSGDADQPTIVLIRGLGTQMIQWPTSFVEHLLARGFGIVRFDNRDVGLSQKFDASGTPDLAAVLGGRADAAYLLSDMSEDVRGVLDALEIERAHIVGMSMGGMIAQIFAATRPERTRSLVSIMSSSGAPGLPGPTPEAAAALTSQPDRPAERESILENSLASRRVLGSPGYPTGEEDLRAQVVAAYERCYHPQGVARQFAAVVASGSRVEQLQTVRAPSLVIHGCDDPLVRLEAGRDTARHIPGAELTVFDGMGHEIPPGLEVELASAIAGHAEKADAASR
jgi:pimeloyl-ACP methyl ester carboxylesterase